MANITAKEIAELRAKTGLPMMEVKSALIEAGGDEDLAIEILRKKGMSKAAKKAERETKSGIIECYCHDAKIGVILEVLTETDFVARNDEFKTFVHDVALHIAAMNPKYVNSDAVPAEEADREKAIFMEEVKASGKPEEIAAKIVDGKMGKYFEEICLLSQPFIKDPDKTIGNLLNDLIAKIGENIVISRFTRYELGN
ncbi:MAG: translation elongation factor Ts [Patescibacteria group bacterium]|jgi:elongation factor Ts